MSSIVTLQLGQCGNQVGRAFFETISSSTATEDKNSQLPHTFFRQSSSNSSSSSRKNIARAVLIDMEPKVLQATLDHDASSLWSYDPASTFYRQCGSGNNWAAGYNVHGPVAISEILETIRVEVEACDALGGFLALQSSAGGTGSGLGACVTEAVADAFPSAHLMNTVVWPYSSGEVIVQNYNTLLTMSVLNDTSDGILIFENDKCQEICRRLINIKSPSFNEMNTVIARHLAMIFLPSSSTNNNSMSKLVHQLTPHPSYKLLNVKMIPQCSIKSAKFNSHRWPALIKNLHQMHIADSSLEEGINWKISVENSRNKAIANALFIRGVRRTDSIDTSAFNDKRLYASWYQDGSLSPAFKTYCSKNALAHFEKSAALVSNCASNVNPLCRVLSRAEGMFEASAYVHQYATQGIEKEYFEDMFIKTDQVVKNYTSINNY